MLRGFQHGFLLRSRHYDEKTHIRRADVRAKACVQILVSLRHGAQCGQLTIPERVALQVEDGDRCDRKQAEHYRSAASAAKCRRNRGTQRSHIANGEAAWQPVGQDETGHQRRRNQSRDRIQPELRQSRKARGQQCGKAAYGGQHAQTDGRPGPPGLDEQINGIVDRLADQRDAEAERNPMYLAESQRNGRHSGERTRSDWHQSEDQGGHGAVHHEEQSHDCGGAEQRKTHDLVFDHRAGGHGEHAGSAHFQGKAGACGGRQRIGGGLVRGADRCDRLLLGVRIRSCCPGLGNEQCALAVL